MNDNTNRIGSNWGGGTPRTLREAFPHAGSITGEWALSRNLTAETRRKHRGDIIVLAVLVVCLLAACIVDPAFF